MTLLAIAVCFSGFTALSRAMGRYPLERHATAPAAAPARLRQSRWLGWTLLALAFGLCVWDHGWALGPVLWLGAMTLSGLPIAFGLYPFRPQWLVPLAWALPVLAAAVAML